MSVELRILSGARAGHRQAFNQPAITLGRNANNDLRFDAAQDLDVSGQHATLELRGNSWVVTDRGSTNGTFVNGTKISAPTVLASGDVVSLGASGPRVELRTQSALKTEERIAVAVRKETKGLRKMLLGAGALLLVLGAGGYWYGQRSSAGQLEELTKLLATYELSTTKMQAQTTDTAFTSSLKRQLDSMRALVVGSRGKPSAQLDSVRRQLGRSIAVQQELAEMRPDQISASNDDAIAFLKVQIGDTLYGATAFCVSASGILVTNRHNLVGNGGLRASTIDVQFANTTTHHTARIVSLSDDPNIDLAILQIDGRGPFPVVVGVSRAGATAGAALVTIGFPGSYALPMQGAMVKTSLFAATASKKTDSTLQIDSYGQPGSSGSPVFDRHGLVVGVIWGGLEESKGHVVYAVPSDKVVAMLPESARGVVK